MKLKAIAISLGVIALLTLSACASASGGEMVEQPATPPEKVVESF